MTDPFLVAETIVISNYEKIYDVVRSIPLGSVATYGQVARYAGLVGHARQVGYALSALPENNDVPWHRVMNAKGQVSRRSHGGCDDYQAVLLRDEGVIPASSGRFDLSRDQWDPEGDAI